jgi:hypothetical protein
MSGAPLIAAGPELIEREQESAVLDAPVDRGERLTAAVK